jgi:hypothetical protein
MAVGEVVVLEDDDWCRLREAKNAIGRRLA